MSELRATPGPWRTKHGGRTIFIDASIGGGMAQEVAACGPTETWEQQAYNARLIAAAPDLAAAIQLMIDSLEGRDVQPEEAIGACRTALAKARGE